ncbi:MAG TPA: phytanoyl-CoA dioxygenase family protein [Polyangiaceae bacterium]|nr:phytanoyl-CoA dioxygenase family protein [Polyangiaceae bacterium]
MGPVMHNRVLSNFAEAGFALERDVVRAECLALLLRLTTPAAVADPDRHRAGGAFAARGLLSQVPELRRELEAAGLDRLAAAALGDRAVTIDATFFDKHARANWAVPGHQDRIIAIAGTTKRKHRIRDGITYAELDAETLAGLVALRVHFDATDGDTGALCVVPGSHRNGVLSNSQILEVPLERYVPCAAAAGDVLVLRPLLLHRSSPSRGDGQRRVLHVVYATNELI